LKYHLGNSIAIGSGGLEFKEKENPQVEVYADSMSRMSGTENNDSDMELLDEAGNISSGLAIRIHNSIIKYGKEVIKAKSIEDKLDLMAKQNVSIGGLVLMSVAVSGGKSFLSLVSKGLSNRGI
jgi:hypothetical protein|tara:strand:+ start:154 stop:525 length:372 start_codon:yes stop_codon:yes gene_type:complete